MRADTVNKGIKMHSVIIACIQCNGRSNKYDASAHSILNEIYTAGESSEKHISEAFRRPVRATFEVRLQTLQAPYRRLDNGRCFGSNQQWLDRVL